MWQSLWQSFVAPLGCTNVNQMHKLYQEGDHGQLDRIMEIVSRQDYPYATRRKAARILGEIGDPRAVPVLKMALQGYDQRTTLKQDALRALGTIGDQSATPAIGRLLDFSLNTADAELRMAAIEALGQMEGPRRLKFGQCPWLLRHTHPARLSSETRRGVFTGEEQSFSLRALWTARRLHGRPTALSKRGAGSLWGGRAAPS